MAVTFTALEVPYESYSQGNSVIEYVVAGTHAGAVTVRAAVPSKQIYVRGHIRSAGAAVISLKNAASGTVIAVMEFLAAGTQEIPKTHTKAGELLEFVSTTNVAFGGLIKTLAVAKGNQVPPIWAM